MFDVSKVVVFIAPKDNIETTQGYITHTIIFIQFLLIFAGNRIKIHVRLNSVYFLIHNSYIHALHRPEERKNSVQILLRRICFSKNIFYLVRVFDESSQQLKFKVTVLCLVALILFSLLPKL